MLKAYFENKLNTAFEVLTEAPPAPLEHDLVIGAAVGGPGLWGLRPSNPLPDDDRREIQETFTTILEAIENLEQRREALRHQQVNLEIDLGLADASNVIPFRRRSPDACDSNARKLWTLKFDCLIESRDPEDLHKMAMELHAHSGRYAFIRHRDLDRHSRLQVSKLMEVGAINLFIPNVLDLSAPEQEVLLKLTASQNTEDRPLLMVGTCLPYADLRSEPGVQLELLSHLARAYIKLTRPFAEYKEQQLIQYFLDSLSCDPT